MNNEEYARRIEEIRGRLYKTAFLYMGSEALALDAVENEYVQPMYLSQTDDEITASVEYLIVDQKQVNVFFRLDSERFTNLSVHPEVLAEDGICFPLSIMTQKENSTISIPTLLSMVKSMRKVDTITLSSPFR